MPGRKGGTWLGLSKTGRLAVLLNVQEDLKQRMRGRGILNFQVYPLQKHIY